MGKPYEGDEEKSDTRKADESLFCTREARDGV